VVFATANNDSGLLDKRERKIFPVYIYIYVYIYFSARLWLRVNRYRGGREGEGGGERRKEQSELKKWNKHANASHFPSLSLPAEYKCADLTMRGTGREKGMEKIWQEGGDFSFLSRCVHCRIFKTLVVTNAE